MARRNEVGDALAAILIEHGITQFERGEGKKHPFIRWFVGGQRFTFHHTGTTGDRRAIRNAESDLRRMVLHGKAGSRTGA